MAKYTDENVRVAWEEFKQHLINVGFLATEEVLNNTQYHPSAREQQKTRVMLAHLAFKQGYVEGSNAAEKVLMPMPTGKPMPAEFTEHGPLAWVGPKKPIEGRKHRTKEQTNRENVEVENVLRRNIDPMKLSDVIASMRVMGFANWNNQNACGFIKQAIKHGANIVKVQTGIYSYDWEGRK